jgi:signal transduction histidine kinase
VSPEPARRATTLWPRSMFGRIALVLFCGLAAAHILTLALLLRERSQTMGAMMIAYLARDVASSVALLERLPSDERQAWLPKIERQNYRYILGDYTLGRAEYSSITKNIMVALSRELDGRRELSVNEADRSSDPLRLALRLKLKDGTPLTIEVTPPSLMISGWVIAALILQLVLLGLFTWLAVRIATKPLARLAFAADALGADLKGPELPENGPVEVARASVAFNAMQRRIARHLAERTQILAAISHDLQSPITRMRLRAELIEDPELKGRLQHDLATMQMLVSEGLELARNASGQKEEAVATDIQALLESLVYDYVDAGHQVSFVGRIEAPLITRPQTLRRIVTNLVDNALKFAGDAAIEIEKSPSHIAIVIRDHGPGIPDQELEAVLQPFYRIEGSRNRDTGGAGLGLAIARQLSDILGADLTISNGNAGGLEARLVIPTASQSLSPRLEACRLDEREKVEPSAGAPDQRSCAR